MAIIISKNGRDAQRLQTTNFDKENYLQEYIYNNPDSIPLYEIKEDIKVLILAREFPTNSGPIDAIGIDKDGEIYLIETKLYKNPDKRTVVAQVLDYGASLWRWSKDFNEFTLLLNQATEKKFGTTIQEKIKTFFEISDEETMTIFEAMAKNLDSGNFKFVVLMDKLESRLKDLIVFVNENSKFDLYAVEIEYYKHEDYEIMIPKIYGAEVKKDIKVSSGSNSTRKRWDETIFMQTLKEQSSTNVAEKVTELYNFTKQYGEVKFGTGGIKGSFNAVFDNISSRSVYTITTNGVLSINFGWLNDNQITEKFRDNLKADLQKEGFTIPENYKDHYIKYEPEDWLDKSTQLIAIIKQRIE